MNSRTCGHGPTAEMSEKTYHIPRSTKAIPNGITKSSLATIHRLLNTTIPGIVLNNETYVETEGSPPNNSVVHPALFLFSIPVKIVISRDFETGHLAEINRGKIILNSWKQMISVSCKLKNTTTVDKSFAGTTNMTAKFISYLKLKFQFVNTTSRMRLVRESAGSIACASANSQSDWSKGNTLKFKN